MTVIVNGRKHNKRCEYASPNSVCRCGCNKQFHGIARKDPPRDQGLDENTVKISPEMGGEITDFLNLCEGKTFQCFCGPTRYKARGFIAYNFAQDRVDGLKDKDNKRWWVYWHCPKCQTDLAWWKIKNRLGV